MRKRDALAGAMLLNSIPHLIMGLTGHRCMTPLGGANSSPAANLAWAGLNLAGGTLALTPRSWRDIDQRDAEERLQGVERGLIAMAAFAAIYELTPNARRRRTERIEASSRQG